MSSAPSRGEPQTAAAFWVCAPGVGETRAVDLPPRGADDVLVETVWTGVSRGTESLVFRGAVPESQYTAMRAPFQDGDFPAPVKYGYLNVGVVRAGPAELVDRTVFCLYPHQTAYVVPANAVHVVPDDVPARRAVLAGAVETAVNALWDAPPLLGDRVAVIGAGMIGCAAAALLARFPGVRVSLVDLEPARAEIAATLGAEFAHPDDVPAGPFDLVLHASASAAGLRRALELVRTDGTVVELSWYGDTQVSVPLGADFHARRLTIRASQVGTIAPARRDSRTHADRMALALDQLRHPAFDALLTGSSPFGELPGLLTKLSDGSLPAICHTISYGEEPDACSQ